MNRRKFNTLAGLSTLGMMSAKANYNPLNTPHQYHLNYAPHLRMFKAHAGDDPIDQLHFMADQGFKSFEDN